MSHWSCANYVSQCCLHRFPVETAMFSENMQEHKWNKRGLYSFSSTLGDKNHETESHDLFTLMFRSCPDNWQLSAASHPFIRHWCNQRAAEHSNRLRTDFPDFSFLSALQRCLGAFTGIWSSLWEDELGPQRTSFATHIRHELQNKPATGSDFSSHMDAISSDAWWEGCFQFLQPNSDWSKESSHTGSDETQLCLVA